MADFGMLLPTAQGITAQLKAQSGETLVFSKIKMGDGTFTGNISNLTDLVSPKVTLDITDKYIRNGIFIVDSFFSNEELETGFYWKEIGLFIQDSSGADVLYSYAYAGANYDYIPATEDTRYAKHIKVGTAIKSTASVTIVESESMVYVDQGTFEDAMDEIDARFDTLETGYVKMSELVETVLYAASWSNSQYTITTDKIVRATQPVEILPGDLITADQLTAIQSANLVDQSQAVGSITVKAMGTVPTMDVPVKLIVRGDL